MPPSSRIQAKERWSSSITIDATIPGIYIVSEYSFLCIPAGSKGGSQSRKEEVQ